MHGLTQISLVQSWPSLSSLTLSGLLVRYLLFLLTSLSNRLSPTVPILTPSLGTCQCFLIEHGVDDFQVISLDVRIVIGLFSNYSVSLMFKIMTDKLFAGLRLRL